MTSKATPILASDRLNSVFKRDERLIDIVAGHSPQLSKLRDSPMRRIMARVTTVEQAARLCGVTAVSLVGELNRALGIASEDDRPQQKLDQLAPSRETELSDVPANASRVELDVRDDLRSGREPFSRIMAAVAALGEDEALNLRATFEPVPLFAVMAKRGFSHHAEQHGFEDWSILFYRTDTSPADHASTPKVEGAPDSTPAPGEQAEEVWLDVRGLEPPEPMVRTLEALEDLAAEGVLIQINSRVPQFLLPILLERGFAFDIDESHANRVQLRIWNASPHQSNAPSSAQPTELDVRPIPPREKHPTIFNTFDGLRPGQAMLLINDHDPRPLRYQLAAERPDSFEWTYQEEGPEVWRVLIERK